MVVSIPHVTCSRPHKLTVVACLRFTKPFSQYNTYNGYNFPQTLLLLFLGSQNAWKASHFQACQNHCAAILDEDVDGLGREKQAMDDGKNWKEDVAMLAGRPAIHNANMAKISPKVGRLGNVGQKKKGAIWLF